uniref:Uncharacterized protein n=1 Tax=Amphora coffeiformis TaxID=265554 RepID=A0A7S3P4G9_9STRA
MVGGLAFWPVLWFACVVGTTKAEEDDANAQTNNDDESGWLQTAAFSPGIMMIFTAHVASIGATVGEYRRLVALADNNDGTNTVATTVWNATPTARAQARATIRQGALQALLAYTVLLFTSSCIVTLLARPLDQRMVYLIQGWSRLVAAAVLALLSVRVAQWLDLYPSSFHLADYHERKRRERMGTTVVELRHAVRWSVAKKLLRPYCVLLVLLQQGADLNETGRITIPVSILAGVATGVAIDFAMYKCRRFKSARLRFCLSITLVVFLSFLSVSVLAEGAYFIASVWDDSKKAQEDLDNSLWPLWAFGMGAIAMPLVHLLVWMWSKFTSANIARDMVLITPHKQRMAMSMFFSDRKLAEIQKAVGTANDDNKPKSQEIDKMEDIVEESQDERYAKNAQSTVNACNQEESILDDPENVPGEKNLECEAEEISSDNKESNKHTEETSVSASHPPTMRELFMKWECCGCVRGNDKSNGRKAYSCVAWTTHVFVCFACLFVVVVNIGSSRQQEAVREKLPNVFELIYRYIDDGPVCAFDDRGAASNITTFPDHDSAHAAGFLILHCGACAACSDWENLELEYTTREFLALESRKCAQKSLFGGGKSDLIECLESDRIGFQGECAVCWAEDILCTKKFCAFIAIQSFLINTLANFEVGSDTITSAACEEAHCEAGNPGDFVACSGATRRRMGVTSSIKRPGSQQCSIVDVNWQELFPDPHPSA